MQNGNPKHISQCLPKPFDLAGVQKVLEEPFDQNLVRYRPGNFGNQLAYVEGHEYIKRLNLAFGGKWSFETVQFEVRDNEVLVLGNPISERHRPTHERDDPSGAYRKAGP